MTKELRNFIGGEWVTSASTETLEAVDPRTERPFARFPAGNEEDIDAAVASGVDAQPMWAAKTLTERIELLTAFIDAVEERQGELSRLESQEMGKPLSVSEAFLSMAVGVFRSSLVDAAQYEFRTTVRGEQGTTEIIRTPVGVVALIVPWNFPMISVLAALVPLLASGNTVVLKPSEKSTPSAVALFESNVLPAGVLNLVLGDVRAGAPLAGHPNIGLIHFTGSVATGRRIGEIAGKNLTRALLELGGKDAAIVDSDVDPVATAAIVAAGAFTNTGQICTAIERVYVHQGVADEFIASLVEAASEFAPGGSQEMGPLVDAAQRDIVDGHVRAALDQGARVLSGGTVPEGAGFYYPPTIVTEVSESTELMTDETFGPVVAVNIVPDFAEGMRRAAGSEYGLGASVFTNTPGHIAAAGSLPVAIVSVNDWLGSDGLGIFEPAGISGLGIVGASADYDASTRPVSVFIPD